MVRVGILGLGGIGSVHLETYGQIDGCEVVAAVYNSPESKAKAESLNLRAYADLKSMLRQEELDLVDICTPSYLHKEQAVEVLNHNIHVLVEKPLALTKRDAQAMFALAEQKNLFLFVGQVVQFAEETKILRAAVRSGKYGKPLDAYFSRLTAQPRWGSGWLLEKEKSGVIPFDLHVHDLDLIISLFGRPLDFDFTATGKRGVDYQQFYRINYMYDDLNVVAEAAWFDADYPFRATWRAYFEEAVLEYNGENIVRFEPNKSPAVFEKDEEVVVSGVNLPQTGMFHNELAHFIDCISSGRASDIISSRQIITGIEILEQILHQS